MTALVSMGLSSCLKNEEPAGVASLREAKVAFINAETAYKQAETALLQAEAQLQEALIAKQIIENELSVVAVEKAKVQLEIAKLELEMEKAVNEYQKAQIQADMKQLELEVKKMENELETIIERHKATMLTLQAATAQAQAEYDKALKLIEAEKLTLPVEQQRILDGYVADLKAIQYGGNYKNVFTPGIIFLQNELVQKNDELLRAKYTFDKEQAIADVNDEIAVAQKMIDDILSEIESFNGLMEIRTVDEIAKKIQELESTLNTLRVDLAKKEVEYMDLMAEYRPLREAIDIKYDQDMIEAFKHAINLDPAIKDDPNTLPAGYTEYEPVMSQKYYYELEIEGVNKAKNAKQDEIEKSTADIIITLDPKIQNQFCDQIGPMLIVEENNGNIVIKQGFDFDYSKGEYAITSNTLVIEASANPANPMNVQVVAEFIKEWIWLYLLPVPTEQDELWLQAEKDAFEMGHKKVMTPILDLYRIVLPKYKSVANNYKLGSPKDLQYAANEAYTANQADFDDATKGEAAFGRFVTPFKQYLETRQALIGEDGMAGLLIVNGSDVGTKIMSRLSYDDYKTGKITKADYLIALNATRLDITIPDNNTLYTPIPTSDLPTAEDIREYNESTSAEKTCAYIMKYGLMSTLQMSSAMLWRSNSLTYYDTYEEPYMEEFTLDIYKNANSFVPYMLGNEVYLTNVNRAYDITMEYFYQGGVAISTNGYYISNADVYNNWWKLITTQEYLFPYLEDQIAGKADIKKLYEDMAAVCTAAENAIKANEDALKVFDDQITEIENKILDEIKISADMRDAAETEKATKEDELMETYGQPYRTLLVETTEIENKITLDEDLLNFYKYLLDAATDGNVTEADELYDYINNYLQNDLKDAKADLKRAQNKLELLNADADVDSSVYKELISGIEAEIEEIEYEITYLQGEFDKVSELLQKTLEIFTK